MSKPSRGMSARVWGGCGRSLSPAIAQAIAAARPASHSLGCTSGPRSSERRPRGRLAEPERVGPAAIGVGESVFVGEQYDRVSAAGLLGDTVVGGQRGNSATGVGRGLGECDQLVVADVCEPLVGVGE